MLEAWLLKVCVSVCRCVDCTYDRKQHRKWLGTVVNPPDRCFPSCSIVIHSYSINLLLSFIVKSYLLINFMVFAWY